MRLFRRQKNAETRSTLANPDSWLIDSLTGPRASSGERVTERSALGLAAVFSATEKISEAVGGLPLKVYRVGDDDERSEARAHRMWKILHDAPNEYITAHGFWSTVTASLLLRGNAFLFKERDELDLVESLWLLDPASIAVEWDGRTKRFVQTLAAGQRRVYTNDAVVHIMGFSLDGLVGCSRIEYCRNTLGTALGRDRYEATFYRQGARVPGVIEYPGSLGEQGLKNLASTFKTTHAGTENMHKVPVLEEGATFKGISMSLADMQFVEQSQLSRSDIATLFNLPASYLNASSGDSLTYATTESNQIQFAQMAVAPLTNRIQKALSADAGILPQNVMFCEFVIEGLLRADMKTRVEYWKALKDMGVVDEAYIASRENLPPPPEPKPVPAPLIPPALANGNGNKENIQPGRPIPLTAPIGGQQ